MRSIEKILSSLFPGDKWHLFRPEMGKSKESYFAERPGEKVFIKFDVDPGVLDILSDMGIAPKVIAHGEDSGRKYIIQEFLDGFHPEQKWFDNHIGEIAEMMSRYHENEELYKRLAETQETDYRTHIKEELDWLDQELSETRDLFPNFPEIIRGVEILKKHAINFDTHLVPVHADPNPSNFLVSRGKISILDWDDIRLSDEMEDVSKFLWKYVSHSSWDVFFQHYGKKLDRELSERFYWRVTSGSLAIACWFARRYDKLEVNDYLNDFFSGLERLLGN